MNNELKVAPSNISNEPASPFNIIARPPHQLGFFLNNKFIQGQSSELNG
jgi:hypothetical protein